uniref:Uncharacterized protein n=1 Tax=Timema douglasi TaxID=61478 RepID=A0A7R8VRL8_TIMDO|nr:unnamed protein product [Timema douglasi]
MINPWKCNDDSFELQSWLKAHNIDFNEFCKHNKGLEKFQRMVSVVHTNETENVLDKEILQFLEALSNKTSGSLGGNEEDDIHEVEYEDVCDEGRNKTKKKKQLIKKQLPNLARHQVTYARHMVSWLLNLATSIKSRTPDTWLVAVQIGSFPSHVRQTPGALAVESKYAHQVTYTRHRKENTMNKTKNVALPLLRMHVQKAPAAFGAVRIGFLHCSASPAHTFLLPSGAFLSAYGAARIKLKQISHHKQNSMACARMRAILTERPLNIRDLIANMYRKGCNVISTTNPPAVFSAI